MVKEPIKTNYLSDRVESKQPGVTGQPSQTIRVDQKDRQTLTQIIELQKARHSFQDQSKPLPSIKQKNQHRATSMLINETNNESTEKAFDFKTRSQRTTVIEQTIEKLHKPQKTSYASEDKVSTSNNKSWSLPKQAVVAKADRKIRAIQIYNGQYKTEASTNHLTSPDYSLNQTRQKNSETVKLPFVKKRTSSNKIRMKIPKMNI